MLHVFFHTDKAFLQTDNKSVKNEALQTDGKNKQAEPENLIIRGAIYKKTGSRQISIHPLYHEQSKPFFGSSVLSKSNSQNAVILDENDAILGINGSREKAIITKLFSVEDLESASFVAFTVLH